MPQPTRPHSHSPPSSLRRTLPPLVSPPQTLQPNPNLRFPVPQLSARILLTPPPWLISTLDHKASTSSSSGISPKTKPSRPHLRGSRYPSGQSLDISAHQGPQDKGPDGGAPCWRSGWLDTDVYAQTGDQPGACSHRQNDHAIADGAHNEEIPFSSDNIRDRVELWLEDQARYYVCDEQADQAMSTSKPTEQSKSSPIHPSTESTPPTSADCHVRTHTHNA